MKDDFKARYVIKHSGRAESEPLYWSEKFGWVELSRATVFSSPNRPLPRYGEWTEELVNA